MTNDDYVYIKKMLKPKDIAKILGCSMTRVYNIINRKDFPKIIIGKRAYIPQEEFENWIKNYGEESIFNSEVKDDEY